MPILALEDIHFSVGGPPLLDGANFALERDERVCIVGRNGVGKSTLLALIDKNHDPDAGQVRIGDGIRVARLPQAIPDDCAGTVFDVVSRGAGELGQVLTEYHQAVDSVAAGASPRRLEQLHAQIDAADGWVLDQRITAILTRFSLPSETAFEALSGGLKRRVLLAQAVASEPDVLLLDEPTNHLDIESIQWLEQFLKKFSGSVVFVTHDRAFLRNLATRIVEIDRGQLTSWPGDYDNYLRRREERANAEALERARFDKKLAQEERWIRQGIKARRTRNEGRVRALQAMREAHAARRTKMGQARLQMAAADRSGRLVAEAIDIHYAVPGKTLVQDFSTRILRGDRVGILGPNGIGKTTLVRLLIGDLTPDSGRIRLGTNLQVAYFDQHRQVLDESRSARDNVAGGDEFIELGGGRRPHVMGYLQDFLFTPDRANAPISRLSGGERNRLVLARLFAQPFNLLVMDEPTNDLDVETLELLEERLLDYQGTLILVSHDRAFMDNVVTSVLVPEGDGHFGEYVGGYSDWLRQSGDRPAPSAARQTAVDASPAVPNPRQARPKGAKLSYKLARELDELPARIEKLETAAADAEARVNDPALYEQDEEAIREASEYLTQCQSQLEAAYDRWAELESIANPTGGR